MKTTKCNSCGTDIRNCNLSKHIKTCDGNYKPFKKATNCPYCLINFKELIRIYTNEKHSSIWNQENVLTIFEIVKQHHRKCQDLNKQTHLPDHKRYSSALLEELLSPDRSKRSLHIAQQSKPSKKSMKKAAALELKDVPIVSGPEEAIAQAEAQAKATAGGTTQSTAHSTIQATAKSTVHGAIQQAITKLQEKAKPKTKKSKRKTKKNHLKPIAENEAKELVKELD
jgi:hypothetical protein